MLSLPSGSPLVLDVDGSTVVTAPLVLLESSGEDVAEVELDSIAVVLPVSLVGELVLASPVLPRVQPSSTTHDNERKKKSVEAK